MKKTINPKIVCPSCGSPRKRPNWKGAGVGCTDDWHKRTRILFDELMEGVNAMKQSRKKNED